MYFDPDKGDHGLPRNPFKSCVVPRPIGWITTLADDGRVNLAPFSQSNLLGFDPGYVMFSAGVHRPDWRRKDSVGNAERRGEFVYNMATYELRDKVYATSTITDPSIDEMKAVGLTPAPSRRIHTPRVAESPISLECTYYTTLTLPGLTPDTTHHMVVGRVIGVHIADEYIGENGRIDIVRIRPLARMGYTDYTYVDKVFPLDPNASPESKHAGLDGGL
jgi:flavin reductase (DIM6/NTAB) family NADH-FMN oxidoreductase RutF